MAQRKKTETPLTVQLTDADIEFVANIMAGDNQTDAYRKAFPENDWETRSITVAASRLRHRADIALTLDQMREEKLNQAVCTRDEHMRELARLRGRSEASGNLGAAVQAEQLRGKVAGHYVEQVADVTQKDPVTLLERIAKLDPGLAHKLAAEKGIDWQPKTAEDSLH